MNTARPVSRAVSTSRASLALGAALLCVGACGADTAPAFSGAPVDWAHPEPSDPTPGDGFAIRGNWPIADGTLAGRPARMLLDTGAQGNAVSARFLERELGIADAPAAGMSLDAVVMEEALPQVAFAGVDFQEAGWSGFDAVVGAPVVSASTLAIDYKYQRAWLGRSAEDVLDELDAQELAAGIEIDVREAERGWRDERRTPNEAAPRR